jgi:hypothetical protein
MQTEKRKQLAKRARVKKMKDPVSKTQANLDNLLEFIPEVIASL